MPQIITVEGLSNAEFFERHAAAGRIGLVGGNAMVDRLIRRVQRNVEPDSQGSAWSHAFILQGRRQDGFHWVVESDLQFHRRHIQLGVQENRLEKYADGKSYGAVGVIDLGLDDTQVQKILGQALEFVANHTRYSLRELVGAWLALRHPGLRPKANLLSRDRSLFCSALVRQVFFRVGIDLLPGVDVKHTAPEDLLHTSLEHTIWILRRPPPKRIGVIRRKT